MMLGRIRNALITAVLFIGLLGLVAYMLLPLLPYLITVLVLVLILQFIFASLRR
jgi:hypothetical protein